MPLIFDEHVKGHSRAGFYMEETPGSMRFKGGSKKPKISPPPPAPVVPETTTKDEEEVQPSLKIRENESGQSKGRTSLRIRRSNTANIDRTDTGVNLPQSE